MIRVSEGVLEEVRRHARETFPHECCGALLGRAADPAGRDRTVRSALPLENAEEAAPRHRYLIPAAVVRLVEREAAEQGLDLVGFYHSHPGSSVEPSARDREAAWPWYCYLIVPVRGGEAGAVRAWRLAEDREGFVAERLVIGEEAP